MCYNGRLLEFQNLVSRKIWVVSNFHTVSMYRLGTRMAKIFMDFVLTGNFKGWKILAGNSKHLPKVFKAMGAVVEVIMPFVLGSWTLVSLFVDFSLFLSFFFFFFLLTFSSEGCLVSFGTWKLKKKTFFFCEIKV